MRKSFIKHVNGWIHMLNSWMGTITFRFICHETANSAILEMRDLHRNIQTIEAYADAKNKKGRIEI